jgi:hypothetical protein
MYKYIHIIKFLVFVFLFSIYAYLTDGKTNVWYIELGFAIFIFLVANSIELIFIKRVESELEPSLCPHGIPWDECYDCNH